LQCSGTYDNGLKVGAWHSYNSQSGYTLESRYSKDTIISIREIKHGVVKTECNFETNTYRAYNDSSILIVLTIFSLDSGAYTIKYDENGNKIAEGCGRFYEAHVIQGYCARGYNLALQWRNECGTWIYYDTKGNIIKED
jgi:antitoxin component YwqK of YwqJK toxin-antitoxin module